MDYLAKLAYFKNKFHSILTFFVDRNGLRIVNVLGDQCHRKDGRALYLPFDPGRKTGPGSQLHRR